MTGCGYIWSVHPSIPTHTEGQFGVFNQADVDHFLDCGRKAKKSQTDWEFRLARLGISPVVFPYLLKLTELTFWPEMRSKDKIETKRRIRKHSDLRQSDPVFYKRLVNWPLFPFGWGIILPVCSAKAVYSDPPRAVRQMDWELII